MTGPGKPALTDRRTLIALAIVLAGWLWVGVTAAVPEGTGGMPEVCFMRNTLGISCPSCGTTRSVMALLSGDAAGAARSNPFGLLVAAGLVLIPLWTGRDLVDGRASFISRFDKFSTALRTKPKIAFPLALIVAANWGWNLWKFP